MNFVRSNNFNLKYQRFTSSGCKDIGIRKFEFVAWNQFLSRKIETRLKVSCEKSSHLIQSPRIPFQVQSTGSISHKKSLGLISWFNLLVQSAGSISWQFSWFNLLVQSPSLIAWFNVLVHSPGSISQFSWFNLLVQTPGLISWLNLLVQSPGNSPGSIS